MQILHMIYKYWNTLCGSCHSWITTPFVASTPCGLSNNHALWADWKGQDGGFQTKKSSRKLPKWVQPHHGSGHEIIGNCKMLIQFLPRIIYFPFLDTYDCHQHGFLLLQKSHWGAMRGWKRQTSHGSSGTWRQRSCSCYEMKGGCKSKRCLGKRSSGSNGRGVGLKFEK